MKITVYHIHSFKVMSGNISDPLVYTDNQVDFEKVKAHPDVQTFTMDEFMIGLNKQEIDNYGVFAYEALDDTLGSWHKEDIQYQADQDQIIICDAEVEQIWFYMQQIHDPAIGINWNVIGESIKDIVKQNCILLESVGSYINKVSGNIYPALVIGEPNLDQGSTCHVSEVDDGWIEDLAGWIEELDSDDRIIFDQILKEQDEKQ